MNGHAKRCQETIIALGFVRDDEATERRANGKTYYTHPLAPTEPLSIYGRMSEQTCRVVADRARQIAGLDVTGAKRRSSVVKERQQGLRRKRLEQEARERADYERRCEEAAVGVALRKAQREQTERLAREAARERELRELMMPGGAR